MIFNDLGHYPCPCCGNIMFYEKHGYEICDICHWEDDLVQFLDWDFGSGANALSLNEHRKKFLVSKNGIKAKITNIPKELKRDQNITKSPNMKKIGNQNIYIEIDCDSHSGDLIDLLLVVDRLETGSLRSAIYIPAFIDLLEQLLTNSDYFCSKINLELFCAMVANKELEHKNICVFEDPISDFMKRCVRNNDYLYFYFKLCEGHFFDYKNIQVGVPIIKVIEMNAFIDFLNKLKLYFDYKR